MRVLVADDDPSMVLLCRLALQRRDHEVIVAESGPEALDRIREDEPDVVLLDVMLPGLDGFAVLERLRETEPLHEPPVLMVSARVGREDRLRGIRTGAVDYVGKPFRPGDLVALVENVGGMERERCLRHQATVLAQLERDANVMQPRELAMVKRDAGEPAETSAQDAFLNALSHELRTPLAAVAGFLTMLADEHRPARDAVETRDLINCALNNARRLEQLLTDLLDLDRLSRGVLQARRRDTDVYALIDRVVESLSLDEYSGPAIDVEPEAKTATVDPAYVERILESLLSNIVRHCKIGTSIWIHVQAESDGIVLAVDDDGEGVRDDHKLSIFEPFRQSCRRDHAPGTGVGLSLVSHFAHLHDGWAWVQDRPGGGSSFRVFLKTASS